MLKATGGTKIEDVNGYTYHVFNEFVAAPEMVFTANVGLTCDWLVIGGGGGGSVQLVYWCWSRWCKIITSVPVIVGNGGPFGASESRGNNGQDSRFGDGNPYSVVAQGGGYGAGDGNTQGGGDWFCWWGTL